MKKVILTIAFTAIALLTAAQNHNSFLGLPLNTNLEAFSQSLVNKGYTLKSSNATEAVFAGEFAGMSDVVVTVMATAKSSTVFYVKVTKKGTDPNLKKLYKSLYEGFAHDTPKENCASRNFNFGGYDYDAEVHSFNLFANKQSPVYGKTSYFYFCNDDEQQIIVEFIDIPNKELAEKEK